MPKMLKNGNTVCRVLSKSETHTILMDSFLKIRFSSWAEFIACVIPSSVIVVSKSNPNPDIFHFFSLCLDCPCLAI